MIALLLALALLSRLLDLNLLVLLSLSALLIQLITVLLRLRLVVDLKRISLNGLTH